MNAGSYIYADCLDEVAETFIGRMLAPKDCGPDILTCLRRPWWQTGIYAGLVCGVVIGLLAFLSIRGSGRPPGQEPAAVAGTARAVVPWQVVPRQVVPRQVVPRHAEPAVAPVIVGKNDHKASRRLLSLGWRRYRSGKYRKASVAFARAVHLNPDATSGYYGLAISLFEQGHNQVALQVLKRALGAKGKKAGAWVLLGAVYQWSGQEQKARKMYRRYLRQQPSGVFARDVRSLLARAHLPVLRFPDIDD